VHAAWGFVSSGRTGALQAPKLLKDRPEWAMNKVGFAPRSGGNKSHIVFERRHIPA
jgi:hypothetical protein